MKEFVEIFPSASTPASYLDATQLLLYCLCNIFTKAL